MQSFCLCKHCIFVSRVAYIQPGTPTSLPHLPVLTPGATKAEQTYVQAFVTPLNTGINESSPAHLSDVEYKMYNDVKSSGFLLCFLFFLIVIFVCGTDSM